MTTDETALVIKSDLTTLRIRHFPPKIEDLILAKFFEDFPADDKSKRCSYISIFHVCKSWKATGQALFYARISLDTVHSMILVARTLRRKPVFRKLIKHISFNKLGSGHGAEGYTGLDFSDAMWDLLRLSTHVESIHHPAPFRTGICYALRSFSQLSALKVGIVNDQCIEENLDTINALKALEELELYWDANTSVSHQDLMSTNAVLDLPRLRRFRWDGETHTLDRMGPNAATFLSSCQFSASCDIFLHGSLGMPSRDLEPFFKRHAAGSWQIRDPSDHAMCRALTHIRRTLNIHVLNVWDDEREIQLMNMDHLERLPEVLIILADFADDYHTHIVQSFLSGLSDIQRNRCSNHSPTKIYVEDRATERRIPQAISSNAFGTGTLNDYYNTLAQGTISVDS